MEGIDGARGEPVNGARPLRSKALVMLVAGHRIGGAGGAAFNGFAVPANSVISPVLTFWHNPAVDTMEAGIDRAKAILAEALFLHELAERWPSA